MQDYSIGGPIYAPADMLTNPLDRLRASSKSGETASGRDGKKVAQEFESIFIAYLLKVMRETIDEANESGNASGKTVYTELFDQEFARGVAQQRGLGIADLVVKSIKNRGTNTVPGQQGEAIHERQTLVPGPINLGQGSTGAANRQETAAEVPDFRLPIQAQVSSGYGIRNDPFTHVPRFHKGLDIAAPVGMDVRAAYAGKVVYSGYDPSYGNTVVIQHSGGLQTRYAHLGRIDVNNGDLVSAEKILGSVGSTGHSTGPHLHFEVTRWGESIDPLTAVSMKGPVARRLTNPRPAGADSRG